MDTNHSKKIKEKIFSIDDFGSVSWVNETHGENRLITRFTPVINEEPKPIEIASMPIVLENLILTDNFEKVWAEGLGGQGEVIQIKSKKGILYLSFSPFEGSQQIGYAKENFMKLQLSEKLVLRLRSQQTILPPGLIGKIFGWYSPPIFGDRKNFNGISALSKKKAVEEIQQIIHINKKKSS